MYTCLDKCPPGYEFSSNSTKECYSACPFDAPYYGPGDKSCRKSCPGTAVHVQNRPECIAKCPETHPYHIRSTCYTVCPKNYPYHTANGQCGASCPPKENRYPFDDQYTCLKECPDDYPVERGGSKACFPAVGTLEHKYYTEAAGDKFVSGCDGDFPFHVELPVEGMIYSLTSKKWKRRTTLTYIEYVCRRECPEYAPVHKYERYECLEACPDNNVYISGENECNFGSCPPSAVQNPLNEQECLYSCVDAGLFQLAGSSKCAQKCPGGSYLDAAGEKCEFVSDTDSCTKKVSVSGRVYGYCAESAVSYAFVRRSFRSDDFSGVFREAAGQLAGLRLYASVEQAEFYASFVLLGPVVFVQCDF